MVLLAAAAILSASPATVSGQAVTRNQARATVRIVRATQVRFGATPSSGNIPAARNSVIETNSGQQPIRLIEFE